MNNKIDLVYHRQRSDVLHLVGRHPFKNNLVLACIGDDVEVEDEGMYGGKFDTSFLHELREVGVKVYSLCSHCLNREPYWERIVREARRSRR